MDHDYKRNFIVSHACFLVTLVFVYFIPYLYPLVDDKFLPPMNRWIRFLIIAVFSILFIFYYLELYFSKKGNIALFKYNRLSAFFWISTLSVFVFLCTSRALLSSDLYEYSLRARMLSVYSLNPYLHIPTEIKNDLFFPLIFWKTTPECYGPLWVLIGVIHSVFFKNSLFWTIFLHKSILLILFLGSVFVFYKLCILLKLKQSGLVALAFLINPLMLIMTVVGGHNEIAMTFFVMLSLYLLYQSRFLLSFLMLALAIHIKFVYVLIIPLYIIYFFQSLSGEKMPKKLIWFCFIGIASLAVSLLLWMPFGKESVFAIIKYYRDLGVLYWPDSIPYAFSFILGKAGILIPQHISSMLFAMLFIFFYIYILRDFFKNALLNKQSLFNSTSFIILALLFTNATPFQAWYLIWVIPFILLSSIKPKFLLTFFLSYFLIMTFWKRMSVLAIPMMIIFFIANRFGKRLKIVSNLISLLE